MELTAQQIKKYRKEAGFTQKEMAELMGLKSTRAWQKKEDLGTNHQQLTASQLKLFLLYVNKHPKYKLVTNDL